MLGLSLNFSTKPPPQKTGKQLKMHMVLLPGVEPTPCKLWRGFDPRQKHLEIFLGFISPLWMEKDESRYHNLRE